MDLKGCGCPLWRVVLDLIPSGMSWSLTCHQGLWAYDGNGIGAESVPGCHRRIHASTEEGGGGVIADTIIEPGTIQVVSIMSIRPAPENDDVYGVVSRNDPDIAELAKSIKQHGLREPILISTDGFIISGHRRRTACLIAKLDHVPVRVEPISRTKNHAEFVKLLVEMNSQRIKSTSVLVRETMVKVDPKAAHQQIKNERLDKESKPNLLSEIDPYSDGKRCKISAASMPLLNAIIRVLNEQRDYWPISARQIHYRLLGPDAPLKHASKPDLSAVESKPAS